MTDPIFLDAIAPDRVCSGSTFVATLIFAVAAFCVFGLILAFPILRGRKIKRRCACAASREALRVLEERERAARAALRYDPKTVDVSNLPQASPELAEYARGTARSNENGENAQ